jgi:hypothetical protein
MNKARILVEMKAEPYRLRQQLGSDMEAIDFIIVHSGGGEAVLYGTDEDRERWEGWQAGMCGGMETEGYVWATNGHSRF